MLELHDSPTPNGLKIRLFFEETGLAHRRVPVRLSAGEQFAPDFLALSPNGKIPALLDPEPPHGGGPQAVFESGAILIYLAQRSGQLLPDAPRERNEVLQWLFWQVGGLGPAGGQLGFHLRYAPQVVPFAIERHGREYRRLLGVLDARLRDRAFIGGEALSIADLACYPWVATHAGLGVALEAWPDLVRWCAAIAARPATQRAYAGVEDVYAAPGAACAVAPETRA